MAQVLDSMPTHRRTEQYPWADWFDGLPRLIEEGEDYIVSTEAFRSSAYQAARRHGVKVSLAMMDRGVALQSSPRDDR
jgi:hypothetical protein